MARGLTYVGSTNRLTHQICHIGDLRYITGSPSPSPPPSSTWPPSVTKTSFKSNMILIDLKMSLNQSKWPETTLNKRKWPQMI